MIYEKIRAYGDKVYINFCGLNVSEDSVAYESFTTISTDPSFVYQNKCYFQVYLNNCAYKL